jgi:hypothetical protein
VLHGLPQPPQLCGSLFVLTHAPLQHTRPVAQTLFVHGPPPVSKPLSKPVPESFFVASFAASAPPSSPVIVPPHAKRHVHNASKVRFITPA